MRNLVVRSYMEGDENTWLNVANESLEACRGYESRLPFDFLRWKSSRNFNEKGLFFALVGGVCCRNHRSRDSVIWQKRRAASAAWPFCLLVR
jgi:hypothetical protein